MLTLLSERNLPPLLSQEQMLSLLLEQEYGYLPAPPTELTFDVQKKCIRNFCAGKGTVDKVTAVCTIGDQTFSFPFYSMIPSDGQKHPFFVHINFHNTIAERYQPTEELIDNGFAVFSFCYKDVTSDDGDFTNGLAGILYPNGERKHPTDPGKLALWAWAAQRVMDYAQTLTDSLDLNYGIVCGHSRLGKTALLTAATDPRFAFAYSNDSGCSGASISRGAQGETVKAIYERFPYWFCRNYQKYIDKEDSMPFDQHYLVASIAPRKVLIGSASEDAWADPISEQLCCFAAAPAFEGGFPCPDRPAQIGEEFFDGNIAYHLRKGLHCFSRDDWHKLIRFVNLKRGI